MLTLKEGLATTMGRGKKKKPTDGTGSPTILNRRARHLYMVEETVEAGMALLGSEVKSLRNGNANLNEAFAIHKNGELWLIKAHISPYEMANRLNHDPLRRRKLLLHRREIRRLVGSLAEQGYTLIPLDIHFGDRGHAKCTLGLCRGKRQYDKRESLKERDAKREIQRTLREKGRKIPPA